MLAVTATDLPRLLACNGSRLMGGFAPPITSDDTVKNEGNAADWLVMRIFSGNGVAGDFIEKKAPNGVYITAEMVEHLEEYLKAIFTPSDFTGIEYTNSYNGVNWQVSGRADLVKYHADRQHLHIGDLKYGWSLVEPENNWTLISHAFGFMTANPHWPVKTVTFTIYQPRPHHNIGRVRSWTTTAGEVVAMINWANSILSAPNDQLNTGYHCDHCPALAVCGAARKAGMNAIEASEKAFNDEVSNDILSFELDQLERVAEVLKQRRKALDELALHRLKQGQIIKNYGTETEQTNRRWKNYVTPEIAQAMTGIDLSEKEMTTPAKAEKRGADKIVVASMTERHNKGVKLIRIDANAKAQKHLNPKGN